MLAQPLDVISLSLKLKTLLCVGVGGVGVAGGSVPCSVVLGYARRVRSGGVSDAFLCVVPRRCFVLPFAVISLTTRSAGKILNRQTRKCWGPAQ